MFLYTYTQTHICIILFFTLQYLFGEGEESILYKILQFSDVHANKWCWPLTFTWTASLNLVSQRIKNVCILFARLWNTAFSLCSTTFHNLCLTHAHIFSNYEWWNGLPEASKCHSLCKHHTEAPQGGFSCFSRRRTPVRTRKLNFQTDVHQAWNIFFTLYVSLGDL